MAAALSLSLIAAALDLVLTGTASPFREWGETASRPFLRLWAEGEEQAELWRTVLRDGEALRAENEALRRENAQIRRRLHVARLAVGENTRLRALLSLEPAAGPLTCLPGWVLPRAGDSLTAEVTVDRGAADGVRAGCCVLDGGGNLLGTVRTVGERTCAVTLLWDRSFRLPGLGSDTETVGLLEGDLSLMPQRKLKLTGLTEEEMVRDGETVVTFGNSALVPAGLTVGTVAGVRAEPGGLTRWALLSPAAERSAGEVFVILPGGGGAS